MKPLHLAVKGRRFFANRENRNILVYFLSTALNTCGILLSTNTFIQAYLVESGFTNSQIGLIGSVDSLSLMVGFFLIVGVPSKVRRIVPVNAVSTLFYCVVPLFIAVMSFFRHSPSWILLGLVYLFQNLGLAFKQTICNKSVVNFISSAKISRTISGSSVIGNLLGILTGLISAAFMTLAFPFNYSILFFTAASIFALSALISFRFRVLFEDPDSNVKVSANPFAAIRQLSTIRPCRNVLICHLTRGFFTSATYYIMVIAIKNLNPGPVFSSYAFTVSTAATMLGAFLFGLFSRRRRTGFFYLGGALLSSGSLLFACTTQSQSFFFILYFFITFGNILVDISVPAGIYLNFQSELLSSVSAARMFLSSAGKGIAMLLLGNIIDKVPVVLLFALLGLQQVLGAVLYLRTFREEPLPGRSSPR